MIPRTIHIILFLFFVQVFAQQSLELNSFSLGEVKYAGFSLKSDQDILIKAVGAGKEITGKSRDSFMIDPENMNAYSWIINAKTRELVWRMTLDNTSRSRNDHLNRIFEGEISLPAGDYEVYYSARYPEHILFDDGYFSLGKLFEKLFGDEEKYGEEQGKWKIRIENLENKVGSSDVKKYHQAIKEQAVVTLTHLNDSEFRQEGFELSKPGKFDIYAIGEAYNDETFDYGWIVDANTSMKVWETLPDKGEHAGGAIKNRLWRETIELNPGSYWVYFVMDDSHSPESWNANPPYDPDFYGLTISGVNGEYDPGSVKQLLKQKVLPIVELIRLGDDEFVQQGFQLAAPMQVRIYAIGEGRRGEMFDYGWITDLETGERVWEMNYNRTRHAGGADKNRLIDEVITLPAGSYVVHFVTDDSHSLQDWNRAQPYNPSNWGITVYPADPKYNREHIKKLTGDALVEDVIAQIVRVKDGRYYQERFTLEKSQKMRVYAIGEGDWDEMYDYGWIEEAGTGDIVWKMTYDKTRWAGGAKKNRKVNETITLDAGTYVLVYNTDGSHSFNDWNDDPPEDLVNYGITLYKVSED